MSGQTTEPQPADDWAGWCRVSDLCNQIGVSSRTGSRWAVRINDPSLATKRPRSSGGSPEWWVSPEGEQAFRAAVITPDDISPDSSSTSPGTDDTSAVSADDAMAEAVRVAIEEARARASRAEGECDRLRRDLQLCREQLATAQRQAEEAERARHSAVEQLERIRAAWWRWHSQAISVGFWARLRGQLPEPPPELVSDRLLTG